VNQVRRHIACFITSMVTLDVSGVSFPFVTI
jgi:hypothetical protein